MAPTFKKINKANVDKFYRFSEPEIPSDRVLVWKKGGSIEGTFEGKQERGEMVSFLLQTEKDGLVAVPKTKAIDDALAGVERGALIRLTLNGKKKLPGGKSFYEIDVELADAEMADDADEESL